MKYLKHFFIFSFKWQLKSFLIINSLTIASLYALGKNPALITSFGIVFLYILFFYSMFSVSTSLGSLGTNQNQLGSSFSGKYLLSLPVSKKDLIVNLMLSNVFSLIPILVSILWAILFWKSSSFKLPEGARNILNFVFDHPGYTISFVLLLYFSVLSVQIRHGVEAPRKLFIKGTFYSYLLNFRYIINFITYMMFFSIFVAFSVIFKNYYIVLIFLIFVSVWEFYKTYRVMTDESLTYFNAKRDFGFIALKVLLIFGCGFSVYFMDSSKYRFKEGSWPQKYSEGDKIFYSMLNGNTSEVLDYIHKDGKLDIVNKYGISLIHVFASTDLSKNKQLEDYFLKNINLALTPMRTIGKVCKESYYCEGVTPVHILASTKNISTLKKVLELLPEAAKVTNSDNESPLHYASATCYYEAVKVFIDAKVDVSKVSKSQETPLMVSAEKGCIASSLLLIKAGANKELKNNKGLTASDLAKIKNHRELSFIIDNFN